MNRVARVLQAFARALAVCAVGALTSSAISSQGAALEAAPVLALESSTSAPPVILIHGLLGDAQSWAALAGHLETKGWSEGCQITFSDRTAEPEPARRSCASGELAGRGRRFFRVVFVNNDGETFAEQGAQVAAAVAKVRAWTGAAKVVLVGHSMGGLAARAYLQSTAYGHDVAGLVTVATPHAGSLLPYIGDALVASTPVLRAQFRGLLNLAAPAVAYLKPDSAEMTALGLPSDDFGPLPRDVRYFSVIAHYEPGEIDSFAAAQARLTATWQEALGRAFRSEVALVSGGVMGNWTDSVVPCASQKLKVVPAAAGIDEQTLVIEAHHSGATGAVDEIEAAIESVSGPADDPGPSREAPTAAAPAGAVDLIFCIDTTGSMKDDIDAVKASASSVIDGIAASSPSLRLALVAYRDYGSAYVTRGYPFTTDKETIRKNILDLSVGEGGDDPEAVYEALLHAIYTTDIGAWRDGVKKVVVLMGDAPPHTRRHTLDEVAKAAEEVDPAHIFPIMVAGAGPETVRAFSELAEKTGGLVGSTRTAADLPREIVRMVSLGTRLADAEVVEGRVELVMGDTLEVTLPGAVRPGARVVVLSRRTPGLVIGEGPVSGVEGGRATVELQAMYGTEPVTAGCAARVVPD